MARAKRHYIPGQIWHITHRCHNRDFLLKLATDRRKWRQWLYESKMRYGLIVLNYIVTSNHIHLLVLDEGGRNTIPNSIKLIASRVAQEYNIRKKRKGAFWDDRYHATAVESEDHLLKCLVYIDLNMVRTGVVKHPSEWPDSGYNEIQEPKRKCRLIQYSKLAELTGFQDYQEFRKTHKVLVSEALANFSNIRQTQWTDSIAVGSIEFIKTIKRELGVFANGRKILEHDDSYQLREELGTYIANFDRKNGDIGGENGYIWDVNI